MRAATLVIDALLGTGVAGPAKGRVLELIQEINTGFPAAEVVSIDMPSGLPSDTGKISGEYVRAAHTVTFTAAKVSQVLPPACYAMGHLRVCAIGSPPALYQDDPALWLSVTSPEAFADLFAPRDRDANKGSYGHVLVVAGSRGKTGAAAMCGMAGLRTGAGLVTVACGASALSVIAAHAAELMTEGLPETEGGSIDEGALAEIINLAERKNVIAIGPGIGTSEGTVQLVRGLFEHCDQPMVVDADALNALAASEWAVPAGRLRILTPHPGEMARLTRLSISEVQADRVNIARRFARERGVCLVLKGDRTVTAFPDGRVWINPTGSPAMATGGTGDVLTGMIAGCLAQFPGDSDRAVAAAVYLHGAAGQIGAREIGEQSLVATDLLKFLPAAIFEIHDAL